jgi:hypothetical protein
MIASLRKVRIFRNLALNIILTNPIYFIVGLHVESINLVGNGNPGNNMMG